MVSTKELIEQLQRLLHREGSADETPKKERKDVALVLSSGGARGMAHVGAIDVLLERGYRIRSVAGTSYGSIVGAVYASGHMDEFKEWMFSMDRRRMLQLTDFSFGPSYFVKGDRIIREMQRFVPDQNIEDLPIPFTAVATDWKTGREVVFDHGSLWTAVRASISVPGYFKPLMYEKMILIDGGLTNPFPLNRVKRFKDDLLVGVNVSGHDYAGIFKRKRIAGAMKRENSILYNLLYKMLPEQSGLGPNFYSMINQAMSISINANAHRAIDLYKPDILVDIPMRRYGGSDYDKSEAISKIGRVKMGKELDKFLSIGREVKK